MTLKIEDKKLEKKFIELLKTKYDGKVDKAIKKFIELLEDFEDAVEIELRKNESSEPWKDVKLELL
jgi:N12 class adenine-specific DNA methylase